MFFVLIKLTVITKKKIFINITIYDKLKHFNISINLDNKYIQERK